AVARLDGRHEALLGRAGHPARSFFQALDRCGEIVVLRSQEGQPLVELAVFVVGHQVDGPDRGEPLLELGHTLAHGRQLARRIVAGEQRPPVPPPDTPRLLTQLFPPYTALRRTDGHLPRGRPEAPRTPLRPPRL